MVTDSGGVDDWEECHQCKGDEESGEKMVMPNILRHHECCRFYCGCHLRKQCFGRWVVVVTVTLSDDGGDVLVVMSWRITHTHTKLTLNERVTLHNCKYNNTTITTNNYIEAVEIKNKFIFYIIIVSVQ